MRITATFPLLILTAVLSNAQPSAKLGTVEGVVTNSVNGDPVKKAIVTLHGAGPNHQAITDAAGHFHFDQIDPGSYSVQANGDGFTDAQGPVKTIKVADDENVKDVALQLIPLARVSGHVFDEDGDPLMLANIQALRYGFHLGRKHLMPGGFATSNDLGEFQFMGLEPGKYIFVANAQQRTLNLPPRTRFLGRLTAYAPTFYPNGDDPGQATASELAPGAALANLDFRLPKVPAFHVRGKVTDASGQPAHDANLTWVSDDTSMFTGRVNGAPIAQDGTFDIFPIVPGAYLLTSSRGNRRDGSEAEIARGKIAISGQDVNDVALLLSPGIPISGRFTVEGPAPTRINGQVFLHTAMGFGLGQDFQAQVGQDGAFTIENAWPGAYLIDVFTGAPSLYVKSIRYGETDISSGSLTVTQGSPGALTVVLGTDGGQVQGTVQTSSGAPATHFAVTLAPVADLPGRRDLIKQSGTDANGNFKFQDIAPGEYKLFAWGVLPDVIDVHEFRKALASHAASVSVGPNSRESVQVQLIPAEEVEAERNKLQ